MQSDNSLMWLCTAICPVALVYGSALKRFPEWLGGTIRSVCAVFAKKSPAAAVPSDEDCHPTGYSACVPARAAGGAVALVDGEAVPRRVILFMWAQVFGNVVRVQLD